jgi:hypothetical protein
MARTTAAMLVQGKKSRESGNVGMHEHQERETFWLARGGK